MKRIFTLTLFTLLFSSFFAQTINVLAPNGGETLGGCSTYTIRWDAQSTSGYYSIDYSTDNAVNWTSVASGYLTPGNGTKTFSWTVPNIETDSCRIRVVDTYASLVRDSSDAVFSITSPITLTIPNGGEVWQGLTNHTVDWNPTATSGRYRLEYSINGGANWLNISNSYNSASGDYNWNVNNTPTTQARFRVTDYYNSCIQDASDSLFTITPAVPILTTPNGGENWYPGATQYIYWVSASLSTTNVTLEYSTDSMSTWTIIAAATPNDGSHPWPVPNTPSTNAFVRVSEQGQPGVNDVSDSRFTIAPIISVTAPNGGQNLVGCQNYTIRWSSSPSVTRFNIDYSTNGGVSWTSIRSNYSTSSSNAAYNWVVPQRTSSNALIRVSNYYNATEFDESDAVFSITPSNNITVTSPNGGEVLQGLGTSIITWTETAAASGRVTIRYSTNGGSNWSTIVNGYYTTNGPYTWNLPNADSQNCLVEIYDYSNTCIRDQSDSAFTIIPADPIITTPNGGENWFVGASYTVSWNNQSVLSSTVRLEYSIDNGTIWNTIVASTANDGSHSWPIPTSATSNQALVRLIEVSNPSRMDTSDAVFTINPLITITQQNGGDSLIGCNTYSLRWNFSPGVNRFRMSYSTNGGSSWVSIHSNYQDYSSPAAYNWRPPNITTNNGLLRVESYYNSGDFDVSDAPFTIRPSEYITLTQPNGGQVFQALSSVAVIDWTEQPEASGRVSISYSTNSGGNWSTIVNGHYTTNGPYNWNVPNAPTTTALVRILDYSNTCIEDRSDSVFTIVQAPPLVTSPNGGENWYAGESRTISWDRNRYTTTNVVIEYSLDSGTTWNTITASTANDGSHSWPTPLTPSTQCLIRVSEQGNPSWNDVSDNTFTLNPPIVVSTPNGGESLFGCNTIPIRWYSANNISRFNIYYSTNNGSSWVTIRTNHSSTSSLSTYNWAMPNTNSSNYLVRVANYYSTSTDDESDATFTVNNTNLINVVSPNGGETFTGLSSVATVDWTEISPASGRVTIQYSTNNGSSWLSVTSGYYTTNGPYSWNVPNTPSTTCRIKVRDYNNTCIEDISDSVWTINRAQPILTSPNGGEGWYAGRNHTISWNRYSVISSSVRLEYSTDGGTTWNTIVGSTTNDGSHSWTTPHEISNTCLVAISEVGNPTAADTSDAFFSLLSPIRVTIPNGGENYLGCKSYTIRWNEYYVTDRFNIDYTTNNGATWVNVRTNYYNTSTSPSTTWTTPQTTSDSCRIRVSDYYNPSTLFDVSNNVFSVTDSQHVWVVTPNGGQTYTGYADTVTIDWLEDVNMSGRVTISYSTNNGSNWTTIVNGHYTTNGPYDWIVPNTPSTQCLVRVQDYSNSCFADQSDSVFTILKGDPVLIYPNGGENLYGGSSHNVRWEVGSIVTSTVRLEYSTDGGTTWSTIVSSTPNDGSHSWAVPFEFSSNCYVRVSEAGNPLFADESDNDFNIISPILVTSPGTGSYTGCVNINIRWSWYYSNTRWNIHYSTNGGTSWRTIRTNYYDYSSPASLSWTLPNSNYSNVIVRVEDYNNPGVVYDIQSGALDITQATGIDVTSPNGGEVFQGLSSTATIDWTETPSASGRVTIQYSTNGGGNWLNVTSGYYTTNGPYSWSVPNTPSTNCLVRVMDYSNNCIVDASDSVFTITPADVVLTYPNGNENFYAGTNYNIQWTRGTILGTNVRLDYSTDNGNSWLTITANTANDGSHSWLCPDTPSDSCLVRVTDLSNPQASDISNAVFDIHPDILIVSPNGNTGNEDFRGCTITSITFTSAPAINRFRIEYSTNGGATWISVNSNLYSNTTTTTYNWTIPNTPTSHALVRVKNYYDNNQFDISDNEFAITQPVILLQPAYGGNLQAGSVHNITWISDGISNFYNIDYSTNGGTTWTNIVSNYNTSTYSYAWTVPFTLSSNCYVRVIDAIDNCKQDGSDLPFTITTSAPAITLTTPNGGDTLNGCGTMNISWTGTGTSGFYNLEYSDNGGVSWNPIVTNLQDTVGSTYSWDYPNNTSYFYLVRITDFFDSNKTDQSDAATGIVAQSISAGTDTSICFGSTLGLNATGGTNYTWTPAAGLSNPNIANPVASPGITSTYTVSSTVGTCSLTDAITVTVEGQPAITASGNLNFCSGDSVILTSSSSTGNQWSNGATTESITVTTSGDYVVTVNNGSGCIASSDTASVTVVTSVTPMIAANGPTTFCDGNSVTLTSTLANGNLWSNGATSQSIVVTTSGNFTVSDALGCGATSTPVMVTVNAKSCNANHFQFWFLNHLCG